MPCRDYEGFTEADRRESEIREIHTKELNASRARADKFVKMLCEALTVIELAPIIPGVLSQETRDWWHDHKKRDAEAKAAKEQMEREASEQLEEQARRRRLINSAMSKLTADERKALNI
jgi:hypothetical protein